jgi:choline dehydrogenase-like flavoprotein
MSIPLPPDAELVARLKPLIPDLPVVSDEEVFSELQWKTLFSLLKVFIPSIVSSDVQNDDALHPDNYEQLISEIQQYTPSHVSRDEVVAYLAEDIAALDDVQEGLRRRFLTTVPIDGRKGLSSILSGLNTTAGSLLLTGSTTPIHQQTLTDRTVIVRKWSQSYLPLFRKLHGTFAGLSKQVYAYNSEKLHKVVGYHGSHADAKRKKGYEFKFKDFSSPSTPTELTGFDAVICGSGPGAGATAHRLAHAGMKVIVLEKGYHFDSSHFPMSHSNAGVHLYENGGAMISEDGSIGTATGANLGGGGTVNWLASLQTPDFVREEWRKEHGLPFATGQGFQQCLDYVCEKMGVAKMNDHEALLKIKHNYCNHMLLEGARRCGMACRVIPQNTGGEVHDCGHCHLGCPSVTKKGPANLWLPEAAERGAEIVQGCWVEKILFDEKTGKRATGVQCVWTSLDGKVKRDLTIKAERVIVSGGAFHSPMLLTRSGVRNAQIGKNLHLHPVFYCFAVFEQRIDPWSGGGILTAMVNALEHGNGDGYGPLIEMSAAFPSHSAPIFPLSSSAPGGGAAELKVNMAKVGHNVPILIIIRDRTSGEVWADKNDPKMIHIKYTPSQADKEQLLNGQIAGAKIGFAMGAKELHACHPDIEPWVRGEEKDEAQEEGSFREWLNVVRARGLARDSEPLLFHSAHQFGTSKMSGKAHEGVVDEKGRVWGYEGLYVADSSVLPTATGVNPQVSTYGIADWIARGIVKEWEGRKK